MKIHEQLDALFKESDALIAKDALTAEDVERLKAIKAKVLELKEAAEAVKATEDVAHWSRLSKGMLPMGFGLSSNHTGIPLSEQASIQSLTVQIYVYILAPISCRSTNRISIFLSISGTGLRCSP